MQKILIVDDQQDILKLLSRRLEHSGFTTIVTSRGSECLELAILHQPDAVLLDILMPDANGLDLCKELRNNPATCSIPILLVSGKILPHDIRAGFDAGAADYIKKPFEQMELIERVRLAIKQEQEKIQQIEAEASKTLVATVVAANHKLKQPLTLISLATISIKRLLSKDEYEKEKVEQKLDLIIGAVDQIAGILDSLSHITKPEFEKYINNINMISIEEKTDRP